MRPQEIATAIHRELSRRGTTAYRASLDAGLPGNAIRYALEERATKSDRLAEICDALGLEFYIGPPRPAPPGEEAGGSPPIPLPDLERSTQSLVRLTTAAGGDPIPDDLWPVLAERRGIGAPATDLADPSALAVAAANEDGMPPGARPVDVVELAVAAGGGSEAADERVAGRIWFARAWLDRRGLDATRCAVIGVRGDSMNPTLPDGCSILVDRARTRRRSGRIYVVRGDDGLVVKRAAREARRWLLVSDNPAPEYAPIRWPADAETIGEVRWMAASFQ